MTRRMGFAIFSLILITLLSVACWVKYKENRLRSLNREALIKEVRWAAGRDRSDCRAILIGDSRVAAWPLPDIQGWHFGKLGFPGATSSNIAAAAIPAIEVAKPDLVIIQLGINDVTVATLQERADLQQQTMRMILVSIRRIKRAVDSVGGRAIVMDVPPPIRPMFLHDWLYEPQRTELVRLLNYEIAQVALAEGMSLFRAARILNHEARQRRFRADPIHWDGHEYFLLNREFSDHLSDPSKRSVGCARNVHGSYQRGPTSDSSNSPRVLAQVVI